MSVSLVQCRPYHDNEPTEVEVDESFFVILFLLAICVDVFLTLAIILLINCKICCLNVTVLLRDSSEYYNIVLYMLSTLLQRTWKLAL